MVKRNILILIGIIFLTINIFFLFHIKFKVMGLRRDLAEIDRQIIQEKEAFHVLKAEWSYLNQPDRIKKLANKYLNLKKIEVVQIYKPNINLANLKLYNDTKRINNLVNTVKIINLNKENIKLRKTDYDNNTPLITKVSMPR